MHPNAARLIDELKLQPHPEGGWYRRVRTSPELVEANGRQRPGQTEIRYLLMAGETSVWHRIDAEESWRWLGGDPLRLLLFDEPAGSLQQLTLGAKAEGFAEEATVSAGVWQSARPLGAFTLVGCRVRPGFVWEGFELLDEGSVAAMELRRRGVLHATNGVVS